jgi:hypothetical protein
MSFSHIQSQFATTTKTVIDDTDNVSEYKVIYSRSDSGPCVYTLDLDISTGDTLEECLILVGTGNGTPGAVYTNIFKYDQPKNRYYVTFSGIEEDDFLVTMYIKTKTVNQDYSWKGTMNVCTIKR